MTAVEPLSAELQRIVAERVAEAEERAWHGGWAAAWGRCAEKIAEAIEASDATYAWEAVDVARRIGAEAQRPGRRVGRRRTPDDAAAMTMRPTESHADASTADVGPSPCSQPSTPQNGSQAVSVRRDPSTNCYCGGPEEIYPHRYGTGRRCKGEPTDGS